MNTGFGIVAGAMKVALGAASNVTTKITTTGNTRQASEAGAKKESDSSLASTGKKDDTPNFGPVGNELARRFANAKAIGGAVASSVGLPIGQPNPTADAKRATDLASAFKDIEGLGSGLGKLAESFIGKNGQGKDNGQKLFASNDKDGSMGDMGAGGSGNANG